MSEIDPQQINSLFVRLHRSLLQYLGECWPWSDDLSESDQRARDVLAHSLATQRKNADRLAHELDKANYIITFGSYPTSFTDLQYLSLTYLLKQVVKLQTENVRLFDKAADVHPDSPLLKQIADSERTILQDIQTLSVPKLAVANVT